MAPPAALVDLVADARQTHEAPPPSKKQRIAHDTPPASATTTWRHPLSLRPSGNAYLASVNLKHAAGGFSLLPDEILMVLLESFDPATLLRLGASCRALFAFTRNDELWRALFTASPPSSFTWQGSWRSTFLDQDRTREPHVDCSNLFSDLLHRPFFCSNIDLEPFAANIPARNQILRLPDCDPDFVFSEDRPLILTSPARQWPVFHDWTPETLLRDHATTKFRAEAVDWPLSTYISYMRNNTDESPLYLFDRAFAEKMSLAITPTPSPSAAYWPPPPFGPTQDLFSVLGPSRPDHRWLILGPARSGSTFHKDPNGTSAWNAVLRGRKYWIMSPSAPPGVHLSPDHAEITAPLSIAEWLLAFHAEARATPGCKEGVCAPGETLFVPAGWFHLVLNLDESLALTQNFVPRHGLKGVLRFLAQRPEQVTGFRGVADPYALFVERLRAEEPGLLEDALAEMEREDRREAGRRKRGKWEEITAKGGEDGGGFAFGFGADEGDDEDVEVP